MSDTEYKRKKVGRPPKSDEELLKKYQEKKEKAKLRYYEKSDEICKKTNENSKKIRDLYKLIKDLTKEGKITFPEEYNEKIKELLLIKD
jgi:hypothetical protein